MNIQAHQEKKVLTFGTLDYCPLICKDNPEKPGIMIEINNEIFSNGPYEPTYKFMSIKRAYSEIENKTIDGFVGGSIENFNNNYFPNTPALSQPVSFFIHKDSEWKYNDINSLQNIQIAAIKDFNYKVKEINEFLKNSERTLWLSKETGHSQAFELINLKRIDVFIGGAYTTQHILNQNKFSKVVKISNSIAFFDNFISLTKKVTEKDRARILNFFDKEMERLKKSGKLKSIYNKYGLSIIKK
ncbi:ABC transporter substrate-binding protein [Halobacteriovorax sp. HLS]|uniref:substrate-binding periplasmic protein n=1 Tax=Halobacteriovorax sp. HLS TaxID=2234000 RepID=UPI0013E2BDD0|nr:transporter substrate-binding domain-containing protein [Halobacteriovorax sp. HLS]